MRMMMKRFVMPSSFFINDDKSFVKPQFRTECSLTGTHVAMQNIPWKADYKQKKKSITNIFIFHFHFFILLFSFHILLFFILHYYLLFL